MKPATPEALQLLTEGALAMARIEATGLRVDTAYLDTAIKDVRKEIARLEAGIKDSKEYTLWAKHFGNDMKLGSRYQLGHIVFDILGMKRNPFMGKSNDVAAFEHLKSPFVQNYQLVERMKKALNNYLMGIRREVVDGYLHPFFDLHTTESYRSSSSRPNFHNQPTRDKQIAKIVRACIIPRKGRVFLEVDYSGAEIKVSYCYHKDPKFKYDMLEGDMHRDLSYGVYLLSPEEMGSIKQDPGKTIRYVTKNRFVFAEFYGSYYKQCAPTLWDAISLYDLKTVKGLSLFEHLESKGIDGLGACDPEQDTEPGTFESIVREVEREMWEEKYPTYNQWKKDWWNTYQARGWFQTLTGFTFHGVFRRNQVLCDPIQGSSFHCLLWAIIQIQRELIKRKMQSRIVNQIHDSVIFDVVESELQDVIALCHEYMVVKVAKHWRWIITPLAVEYELAERNWYEKKPLEVNL